MKRVLIKRDAILRKIGKLHLIVDAGSNRVFMINEPTAMLFSELYCKGYISVGNYPNGFLITSEDIDKLLTYLKDNELLSNHEVESEKDRLYS